MKLTKKEKKQRQEGFQRIKTAIPAEIYIITLQGNRALRKKLPGLAYDIWLKLNSAPEAEVQARVISLDGAQFDQYMQILQDFNIDITYLEDMWLDKIVEGVTKKIKVKVKKRDVITIQFFNLTYKLVEHRLSKARRAADAEIAKQQNNNLNEQSAESTNSTKTEGDTGLSSDRDTKL